MRFGTNKPARAALLVVSLSVLLVGLRANGGDEPGLFGRLFRGNGSGSSAARSSDTGQFPSSNPTYGAAAAPSLLPPGAAGTTRSGSGFTPAAPTSAPPTSAPGATPSQRIRPQPRNSSAATEADPLVTRIALGRSDDGKQFGMFLQVFADGTVIDGEGVHRVSPDVLRPVAQAVQANELYRLKGHCGAPATDYIEQIYLTVYQQRLGGMRSNSFSISGNPQGCDPAVRQLHAALEALVTKVSGPAAAPPPASGAPAAAPVPAAVGAPASTPASPAAPSDLPPPVPSPTISARARCR